MGLFDVLDEGCVFSAFVAYAVVVFDEMHIVSIGGRAHGYPMGPTHIVKTQDFFYKESGLVLSFSFLSLSFPSLHPITPSHYRIFSFLLIKSAHTSLLESCFHSPTIIILISEFENRTCHKPPLLTSNRSTRSESHLTSSPPAASQRHRRHCLVLCNHIYPQL